MSPERALAAQFARNRRWLVTFVVLQIVTLLAVALVGIAAVLTTLGNRQAGQGNRTVSCTILDRVDSHTQLAECAAVAAKKR